MKVMREGVGVEASLCWVTARFGQRAVTDYFDGGQHREFVIDAAAAVEFAAKAVVARHDADGLYELDDGAELTRAQRLVLNPALGPDKDRPIGSDREDALIWLLQEGKTISASDAVKLAGSRTAVDVSAANRLIQARNSAVHLGDVDSAKVDKIARDFLRVIGQLWIALNRNDTELWGDLVAIAAVNYLKADRTPVRDAEVRVVRAKRSFHGSGLSGNRHSRLPFVSDSVRCPACGHGAILTTQPVGSSPPVCIPDSQRDKPVDVLDCPVCGLALFGMKQIRWAEHAYPYVESKAWHPADFYR